MSKEHTMPQPSFDRVRRCLKLPELVPVIFETFSRREIARVMTSNGVIYPGVRIESIPREELVQTWAEDALKDPVIMAGLVKALDRAHEKDIRQVRLLSLEEIERTIESVPGICRERKIGGLIWALARDERPQTEAMTRLFLGAFYRFLEKQDKKQKKFDDFESHLLEGRLNKKETEKIRKILLDLFAKNKETQRTLEKTIKEKEKRGEQIEDLKEKERARELEATSLRNDLAELRKESARKEDLIRAQEQKFKTISREEEESLRRRVHDLERQERKLRHEIAGLEEKSAALAAAVTAGDSLCRRLQDELQQSRLDQERLESEIKHLAKQPAGKDAAAAPEVKTAPPRKDKGRRLGVFVDMRSMGQACRQLRRKIDFQKLLDLVVLDRYLVKSAVYVMTAPGTDHSRFLNMLERNGFQVRSRNFTILPDGSTRGGWNAGIAVEMIHLAEKMNLDIVHLVSGDGDFVELFKFLKAKGIRTEASGFEINSAEELRKTADEFVLLDADVLKDESSVDVPVNRT
ncbi:MAG: NYN domain-containing protein [Candidatus Omnitrophica bacterium]|nr:NYN domain-containing protein [Candidatus Omnitrophota bacterium]